MLHHRHRLHDQIDLVYTWVDSSDPVFIEQQKLYPPPDYARQEQHRWKQNDELRYSLRSVEQFAPWFRLIHIVTNGQRPEWLNLDHPKIRLVTHRDIYEWPEHLPTFNSRSIDMHLGRIPELSEYFVYSNDDTYLGSRVTPYDFFTENGKIVFVNGGSPVQRRKLEYPEEAKFFAGIFNAAEILEKWYPGCRVLWPIHQMKPHTKTLWLTPRRRWPEMVREVSAGKYRCMADVCLNYCLLPNMARFENMAVERTGADVYCMMGDEGCYEQILRDRPKLFCINDTGLEAGKLAKFLNGYFPKPSAFETVTTS